MRFLLIIVVLAMLLTLVGVMFTNIETSTTVTLWKTTYRDVPLWSVVFLSTLAGVVSVGIIGVVDGALVRLRNRRMIRELRRLETELNFLRTQSSAGRTEPDLPVSVEIPDEEDLAADMHRDDALVTAPVYGADDEEDDPYTGGRAV